MNKLMFLICVMCIVLGVVSNANATLSFFENFNYSPGVLTTVSLGNWTTHGGTGGQDSTLNTVGDYGTSLAYFGLTAPDTTSNRLFITAAQSEDVHRCLPTNIFPPGDVYCSVLVKCTLAPTTQDYFLHFNEGPIFTSNFRVRVYAVPTTAGNVGYAVSWGSLVQLSAVTSMFSLNTTHLIVFKASMIDTTSNALGNDTGYLWIDPPSLF